MIIYINILEYCREIYNKQIYYMKVSVVDENYEKVQMFNIEVHDNKNNENNDNDNDNDSDNDNVNDNNSNNNNDNNYGSSNNINNEKINNDNNGNKTKTEQTELNSQTFFKNDVAVNILKNRF